MSILIVRDDPFVANTIREVLGEPGFCRCRASAAPAASQVFNVVEAAFVFPIEC